jgi:tRNA(fMet)-specific endonuclease VapC
MIVADTDVLIDFLGGVGPGAERVALELRRGALSTTAITRFELLAGAGTEKSARQVRQLLDALPCLPLDTEAADRAADVRRTLSSSGREIGMGDSLIAGITLRNQGVLLTRNRKHFARVTGLQLADMHEE